MTAFILKLIASASMLIDHAGLMLFNDNPTMRMIGRLAFPIFAFFIAEGFRYTRDRGKYFMRVFALGLICQIVYTIADGSIYIGILLVFSLSIMLMYLLDCLKTAVKGSKSDLCAKLFGKREISRKLDIALCAALFAVAVGGCYLLCENVAVDYGFWGIMLPVAMSLFSNNWARLGAFTAVLGILCATATFHWQPYSLLTLPLLALYNSKPGKYRMKYFFYVFYPAHLAILYLIDMLR